MLYVLISCSFVCLFILRDILDIIILVRFMQPPCMLNWSNLLHACLRTWLACALQSGDRQNDRENSARARDLKSTGRTLSEVVLFGCVVILLQRVVELFRKSTAERNVVVQRRTTFLNLSYRRGRCCSSLDIFSRRVSSSWTLLFNADHQRDDFQEFCESSAEAAGSYCFI